MVHLGQLNTAQILDLVRVSPDDLFPVGSSSIRPYSDLADITIIPGEPMAHIAAEVTVEMLQSQEFTIGNELPEASADGRVRNGPLASGSMFTLFYRAFGDARRKRQVQTAANGGLFQSSSFQPLQMTGTFGGRDQR